MSQGRAPRRRALQSMRRRPFARDPAAIAPSGARGQAADPGFMSWTTPEQIAAEVEKRWRRGDILAARVTGEPLFPLRVRLRRPSAREVVERFGDVGDWARALNEASREARGFGFELEREEVRSRVHGANTLPVAAIVPTEGDALRLIRQSAAADRFQALADATLRRYPALRDWLARRPLTTLDHVDRWGEVLASPAKMPVLAPLGARIAASRS